jgi:hypothetical protein
MHKSHLATYWLSLALGHTGTISALSAGFLPSPSCRRGLPDLHLTGYNLNRVFAFVDLREMPLADHNLVFGHGHGVLSIAGAILTTEISEASYHPSIIEYG